MRPTTPWITAAFVMFLAFGSGCSTTEKEPASPPAGVLRGIVKFDGVPPKRAAIDVALWDPAIVKARNNKPLLDSKLIVAPDGSLADALVYVSAGLPEQTFAPPVEPAIFEFDGSELVPHARAVVVGSQVRFINRDATLHNVHCTPKINVQFNIAQPRISDAFERVFNKPELAIEIRCDVHPWERAVLHVMKHPYFAVTKPDGSFEVSGLPPGEYELTAVHAYNRITPDVSTIKVNITANHGAEAVFTYRQTQVDK